MRLKKIKPGMVIHCKNDEEKKVLLEEAERLGYVWRDKKNKPTNANFFAGSTIHFYENNEFCDYKHITWSDTTKRTIEFSDHIIPELTAEEALKTYVEMCSMGCRQCTFKTIVKDGNCEEFIINNTQKAIEIISEWKSDHENKEPEVEWVYRVFGAENFGEKFFETKDEAIKRCEELAKSQKTKKYARYERVCRVKE